MLGIEWKVNDKSPYIDQATQENISKCFHRASYKLKMFSMQFQVLCAGATEKEMKLDIYMGKHASLSSCFFFIMFSSIVHIDLHN